MTTNVYNFTPATYADATDRIFRSVAAGGYSNQFQTFLTGIDRFQRNNLPANSEHSGYTFITRPRLCLTSASLRQSRIMTPLDTDNPKSLAYMIRCLLDTKYCNDHSDVSTTSPLLNTLNPFFTPLINSLVGLNGWPDPIIQTTTTEGGFHSEDQTFAIGSDDLSKTYDLSLTFKDIQYAPITAIFQYWLEYISCVTKNRMVAYKEDIDAQRMNYTVSIYRFNVDPTRRYITKYAKATGCFPKSVPLGGMFNVNENELYVGEAGKFTIPFVANDIKYNDYGILMDFNILVKRYCSDIESYDTLSNAASNNFSGIPYIESTPSGLQLVFKAKSDEVTSTTDTEVSEVEDAYRGR